MDCSAFFVIGQSNNYFGFGFMTLNWKLLYDHATEKIWPNIQVVAKEAERLVFKAKQQFLSPSEIKPPKDVPFKVCIVVMSKLNYMY